jgi:hypothetical protein
MTKQELEVANAIFETIRLYNNYPIKSLNDCWVEVEHVAISDEQLRRSALEIEESTTLVVVEARTAFIEVDQEAEPISTTVTEGTQTYSIALHKNKQGAGLCGHPTVDEALGCELNRPAEPASGEDSKNIGTANDTETCPTCGASSGPF